MNTKDPGLSGMQNLSRILKHLLPKNPGIFSLLQMPLRQSGIQQSLSARSMSIPISKTVLCLFVLFFAAVISESPTVCADGGESPRLKASKKSKVYPNKPESMMGVYEGRAEIDRPKVAKIKVNGDDTFSAECIEGGEGGAFTITFSYECAKGKKCAEKNITKTLTGQCPFMGDSDICGNGQPDSGEECDDGNLKDGDGCSSRCKKELCGDKFKSDAEECDDGNKSNGDGCSSNCTLEACGDNVKQVSEGCDDGNGTIGDGCSNLCEIEYCGDGIKHPNHPVLQEECDDRNTQNNDGCSRECKIEKCGDKMVQISQGEQCDDGNESSEDGCSALCKTEFCGDGIKQEGLGELCDDANLVNGDGCSASCRIEGEDLKTGDCKLTKTICVVDRITGKASEYLKCLDDNSILKGPTQTAACTSECEGNNGVGNSNCSHPVCGNKEIEPGEECDNGEDNLDTGTCTTSCLLPDCGDGFVQESAGEICDDENENSGDGCSDICKSENCDVSFECASPGNLTLECKNTNPDSGPLSWTLTAVKNIQTLTTSGGTGAAVSTSYACGECKGEVCTGGADETATIKVAATSKTCSTIKPVDVLCG